MSFYDLICDNRNALCCLACSVVLHTHSQKICCEIGLSGTLLCLRRMMNSQHAFIAYVYVTTSMFLAVYAELISETAEPSDVCNE